MTDNNKNKTFNKGEWSELYALIKIAHEKKVFLIDENLDLDFERYFPVLSLLRPEAKIDLASDGRITVQKENVNSNDAYYFSDEEVAPLINTLLRDIKLGKGSFKSDAGQKGLEKLALSSPKANSTSKEDVRLIVRDYITNQEAEFGLSIKSYLGGSSTLLNASKDKTNLKYKVMSFHHDLSKVNGIDTRSKVRDRLVEIKNAGAEIQFEGVANSIFSKNLIKIDSLMPQVYGEMVLAYYQGHGPSIAALVKFCCENDRFKKLPIELCADDVEFKVKQLLLNIALGMVPNTLWDGILRADGGYLIVKDNGDLGCFHIYNFSGFSSYLFKNTKFDTPSTSRHVFGTLAATEDGGHSINLNVQIRFI